MQLKIKAPKVHTIPSNLKEVVREISRTALLSDTRRRDLISACNSIARLAGRPTSDISCEVSSLRDLFAKLHHVQGNISRKRLANIRGDLSAALELVQAKLPLDLEGTSNSDWNEFLGKATAKHQAYAIARFARFCTAQSINPNLVRDEVIEKYKAYLEIRLLTGNPEKIALETAKTFNTICKRAGLSFPRLATSRGDRYVTAPMTAYPETLQADFARYIKRLRKPDLFSDDGPTRALRPTSLRNIEAHLRQTLDAAVRSGYPPEHFKTLSDVIDLEVMGEAINQITERSSHETPPALLNILSTLLAIAKFHVRAPEELVKAISAAKRRISERLGGSQRTMSQKSQRRMDQFLSEENISRIIGLPEKLIRRAAVNPARNKAAMEAMAAAAIALLLACPALRIANLAALNSKEDLTRRTNGKLVFYVVHIIPEKTKGRQAIDALIEPPFSTIIDHYLKFFRCRFGSDEYVFPRLSGGPRASKHLGEFISKTIWKATGIRMNPHLFRHFGSFLYLEAHPGEYESVRRLVGHAKIETTTSFYAPQSSRAAFHRYDRVLQRYRGGKI